MTKESKSMSDEKFANQDFDIFKALEAIDKKDYDYYDKLTTEQKKKFVPFMMLYWTSAIKGNKDLQHYYLSSVDYHANKYFFNEQIQKNPKLQWLLLCASSPGIGKQFHQWLPQLKNKTVKLEEQAKSKDVKEYFNKIYKNTDNETLNELTSMYVERQHKQYYLAKLFPNMKFSDIQTLESLTSDEDIKNYEKERGND